MKYKSRTTRKVIKEMAIKRNKLGKLGDRNGSLENRIIQQTGQGETGRSSAIAIGKVSNSGDKLEKEMDTDEVSKKYKKKNLKLALRQGRISQEEYDRQMESLNEEMTTVEFTKKDVLYKNKKYTYPEFFSMSRGNKRDDYVREVLAYIMKQKNNDRYNGTLEQYIKSKFGEDEKPFDFIKRGKMAPQINKEVE